MFFTSCIPNPEEDPDPVVNVNDILLKKITVTDLNGEVYSVEFTYSGKKLAQSINSNGTRVVYTYEQDLLVKEETFNGTTLVDKATYVYDISSNLITYIEFDYESTTADRWVYVHNSNGTISFENYTGDLAEQTEAVSTGTISATQYVENNINPITQLPEVITDVFTYDSKNNPFKNVTGFSKIIFTGSDSTSNYLNNILTVTSQIDDTTPVVANNNTYVYNANNFPISSSTTTIGGVLSSTQKYTYY